MKKEQRTQKRPVLKIGALPQVPRSDTIMIVICEKSSSRWQTAFVPLDTPVDLLCEYSSGNITGRVFWVPNNTAVHICLGDYSGHPHKYMEELINRKFRSIDYVFISEENT